MSKQTMKKSSKTIKDLTQTVIEKLLAIQPFPADKDFYTEAKSWYGEVYESLICSRDRYRLLAILLGILLAISITMIASIIPLKRYYYRLIAVNQQTGEVTQLKELEQGKFDESWVVSRYFINQYIESRNSYSYEDIKRTFNLVLALSDKKIAAEYEANTVDSNPKSAINVLGKDSYREVVVLNVSQLNNNTAMVRFKTLTRNRNDLNDVKKEDSQAIVKWNYQNFKGSLQDRDKNPVGFKVTYYQVSPVLPEN